MNNPNLTPRQQEAQQLNRKIYNRYSRPVLVPVWMAAIFAWLARGTPYDLFGRIPQQFQVLIGIVLFIGVVKFVIFAGGRASNGVRAAGLMDEKHEVIARTATTFEGKTLAFEDARSPWKKLGFALVMGGVAALTVWFGVFLTTALADRILMGLGFTFFFGFAIHTVAARNQPFARLDERGVSGYHRDIWPRLVRWHEISSAHIYCLSDFRNGGDTHTITLKNAAGETLLRLSSAAFNGAPIGLEARFIAELKRRLTAATPPQDQENSMAEPTAPRQQEAQKLSWKIYHRYSRPVLGPMLLAFYFAWFARGTRFDVFGQMSINARILTSIVLLVGVVTVIVFANNKATDAVRDAGLLDEGHETIRRTAATFAGEDLAFGYSKNRWSDLGLLLVLVGVAALLGWFALCFATQITERILAALGFAFFFGYALLTVATSNQPAVSLNERGVFSYYRNFWPRLVRWREIESAHFHRQTNSLGGPDICTIRLKNAADETLLTLNAATFLDAPPGFEARFVAELRRRLMGEVAT